MDGVLNTTRKRRVVKLVSLLIQIVEYTRQTEGTDGVEAGQEHNWDLAKVAHLCDVRNPPGPVKLVGLVHKMKLITASNSTVLNQACERAHSVGAAREAEHVDLVAIVVVREQEVVEVLNVLVNAGAKVSADVLVDDSLGADAGTVEDDLLLAIAAVDLYGSSARVSMFVGMSFSGLRNVWGVRQAGGGQFESFNGRGVTKIA
jgi:hypothetical protein